MSTVASHQEAEGILAATHASEAEWEAYKALDFSKVACFELRERWLESKGAAALKID